MTGIIEYGAGNIFSLTAALERQGIAYQLVDRHSNLEQIDRYIIPGVGHAGAAMTQLRDSGMDQVIVKLNKPVLGICVGMQLMTPHSEEGDCRLLGLFPEDTLHFRGRITQKVPHMGWNRIEPEKNSPIFEGLEKDPYFYFVHSYYVPYRAGLTSAVAHYGVPFTAAFERENFYGVQFHPEKSGIAGARLLANFCNIY